MARSRSSKRKGFSKRTRFEVFKRDSFTCQFCGRSAPEIVLEIDHLDPVSRGGTDDLINLITSCRECNSGKSNIALDDTTAVTKQRTQLKELQERREQLELIVQWRNELTAIDNGAVAACVTFWSDYSGGSSSITDKGRVTIRRLINTFGLSEVLEAIKISLDSYDTPARAFEKIGGVCRVRATVRQQPHLEWWGYLFSLARKRVHPSLYKHFKDRIKDLLEEGVPSDSIRDAIRPTSNEDDLRRALNLLLEEHRERSRQ